MVRQSQHAALALSFCLWLQLAEALFAQPRAPVERGLRFDHISVAQGLSYLNVRAIIQDPQGFLWFGTDVGLNKYDGVGNETGASIKIIITPPFWQTWWIRLSAIAAAVFTLFYWHKRRTRSLEARFKFKPSRTIYLSEDFVLPNPGAIVYDLSATNITVSGIYFYRMPATSRHGQNRVITKK